MPSLYLIRRFLKHLASLEPNLAAHVVMLWQVSLSKQAMAGNVFATLVKTFERGDLNIMPSYGQDYHSLEHTIGDHHPFEWFLSGSQQSMMTLDAHFLSVGIQVQMYWATRHRKSPFSYTRDEPVHRLLGGLCRNCLRCTTPVDVPVVPCMAITECPFKAGQVQFGCTKVHCGPACGSVRLFVRRSNVRDYRATILHADNHGVSSHLSAFVPDPSSRSTSTDSWTVGHTRYLNVKAKCSPQLLYAIHMHNTDGNRMQIPLESLRVMIKQK
jgi:hypothetical protein